MIHNDRLSRLLANNEQEHGDYILYWIQQSQRVNYNHALDFAISLANKHHLPLLVVFVVTHNFLGANERHYTFMFEGLAEVAKTLKEKNINFAVKVGDFAPIISSFAKDAHSVVFDFGYLRSQRVWRREVLDRIVLEKIQTNVYLVESDLIVPVRQAYSKVAYGAYVIRPHLMKKFKEYLDTPFGMSIDNKNELDIKDDINLNDLSFIENLNIDHSVKKSQYFHGGYIEAQKHLTNFITNKLAAYPKRSDPSLNIQSYLSMYLQFGQISSLEILMSINSLDIEQALKDEFIEQLLVRRELAYNYVFYNKNYDSFEEMTEPWAYETMNIHTSDKREYIYSKADIEAALTHDEYFNAAMIEMKKTGFMANYMRMYWAKQIMTWTNTYEEAYRIIVELNNKYFIDGRNPNSYMNIAWCFGKMDRPWPEKHVWGKLRSMNAGGLKRKFNIDAYVKQIDKLL